MHALKGYRGSIWLTIFAAAIVLVATFSMRIDREPGSEMLLQGKRVELVDEMRVTLVQACEASNSAILSNVPDDSQAFADQAHAAIDGFAKAKKELNQLLKAQEGTYELELMDRVTQAFERFRQIEPQILSIAVRNTNSEAFQIAFGPAKSALLELDAAVSRISANHLQPPSEANLATVQLASDIRLSALRMQSLLAPHIAEASIQRMDEFESALAESDRTIQTNLDLLSARIQPEESNDLQSAKSHYDDFQRLLPKIVQLSRENTEVRSVALALTERRQAMLACQDALVALKESIQRHVPSGRK